MNTEPQTSYIEPQTSPGPREYARGATTQHAGLNHLGIRANGGRNRKDRFRLTPAVARRMKDGPLIDIYEGTRNGIQQNEREPGSLRPNDLARAKKQNAIVKNVLLARGYDADSLDYDPEEHLRELEMVVE